MSFENEADDTAVFESADSELSARRSGKKTRQNEKKDKKKKKKKKRQEQTYVNPLDEVDEPVPDAQVQATVFEEEGEQPQTDSVKPLDEVEEAVPDDQVEATVFEDEMLAVNREVRKGRDGRLYLMMLFGTALLIPVYVLLSIFFVWMAKLVPNALSILVASVSCTTTCVLYLGYAAARSSTEFRLRLFSFMMTVVISMQVSCVVIFLLDTDNILRDAFIGSAAESAVHICATFRKSADALPLGAGVLPVEAICECDSRGMDGNSTVTMKTCMRDSVEGADRGLVSRAEIGIGLIGALLVEVLLARIAWGMMKDLDVEAAKKGAKKKGGLVTGHIRGTIIAGDDLRSEQQNILYEKSLKKWKWRRRTQPGQVAQEISNRCVQLKLISTDLPQGHEHKHQVEVTEHIEDDASPTWNHTFEGWATYASSTAVSVKVFDKVKKNAVLVGQAKVQLHGQYVPDFNYVMDGDDDSCFTVPLRWKDKKGRKLAAGQVTLSLVYMPAPDLLGSATEKVTKSWYFEGTVLWMVFLSMVVLALQSPAEPPSVVAYGATRVLDIFLGTHLAVELLMEFSVKISQKEKWHKDTWFLLSLFVLICNWACIVSPPMSIADIAAAEARAHSNEEFVDMAANRAAHVERGDISGSIQHGADAQQYWEPSVGIDGAKTAVASRLIEASLQNNADIIIPLSARVQRLLSVGRVLRIVRPIRTLRMIHYVDIILNVVRQSMQLIGTVCVLIAFLISIYALIGMSSFNGALQYQCIGEPNAPIFPEPTCSEEQNYTTRLLGNTKCPVQCPVTLSCQDTHHWCAPLQDGLRPVGSDEYGFRNFDWFYRAVVTLFVQTTGDGGLHTLPAALQDAGCTLDGTAWLITFSAIILVNLISVNLFLAVCCSVYSDCTAQAEELEIARMEKRKAKEATLLLESQRINAEGTAEEQRREARRLEAAKPYHQRVVEKQWEGTSRCVELRSTAQDVMLSPMFEHTTSLLIVANTIAMAMVHDDMDPELLNTLQILEFTFLVCYIFEAIIKVLGCGMEVYISSSANRFDLFVILGSGIGVLATYFEQEVRAALGLDARSLQSLRAVRLLRALQIVRFLTRQKALMQVLQTVFRAWKPLLVHSIFCMFSVCMFSIVCLHLFGGSLGPEATMQDYDTELSANFESFGRGVMTVFELTVGEEWSHTMWWYTRYAHIGHGYPEIVIQMVFVAMYIWMNCILFSLYIAMLLENFSVAEQEKIPTQKRMYDRHARKVSRRLRDRQSELLATLSESRAIGHANNVSSKTEELFAQEVRNGIRNLDASENKALYILRLDSPIRLGAARVQASPLFGRVVLVLILISCFALGAEGPPGGDTCYADICIGWIIDWINVLVLGAFILEAVLKCIIHGFILASGPTQPYLATKMNRLDFFIILTCLVSYIPMLKVEGAFAKILRLGRVITPMLNLSKNPDIKLVFISFVRAGPDTAIILLPLVLMGIVFAILGVSTFGQSLKGCIDIDDPLVMLPADVFPFGNATLCQESEGYDWVSPVYNFDNSIIAMITLTTRLTDGAHSMMVETTQGAPASRIYWVMFHLCFTCFFLNLFIGVLSASFEKSSGIALMTYREKQWHAVVATQVAFRPVETGEEDLRPIRESQCCRRSMPLWWFKVRMFCFNIASNERLVHFFHIGIVVNAITLSMETYPARTEAVEIIGWLNSIFLALNACEVTVNLLGLGARAYFGNGWLVSDLVLVVLSLSLKVSGVPSGVEVLRLIRVFRIFVLVAHLPALVALIDTVVGCIRASLALILITSIIVYLFVVVGMNLFGLLPSRPMLDRIGISVADETVYRDEGRIIAEACPGCEFYTDVTNFYSFFNGVQLLLQSSFGQGIGGFVADLERLGGDFVTAFVFFAVFYIATAWVCINLLLVTVLSNFDLATTQQGSGEEAINPIDLDGFAYCWASLTIGAHASPAVESSGPELLEHLSNKLQEESKQKGTDFVEPTTVNFEDGEPSSSGTLTIRIKSISVPPSAKEAVLAASKLERAVHDLRPYCRVTAVGDKMTSSYSLLTSAVELKGEEAEFISAPGSPRAGSPRATSNSSTLSPEARGDANPAANRNGSSSPKSSKSGNGENKHKRNKTRSEDDIEGVALRMHLTSFHTHLDFSVKNSFKFCDDWIGGERVLLDEIREKKFTSMELELRSDAGTPSNFTCQELRSGGSCVWERYGRVATSAHGEALNAPQNADKPIIQHNTGITEPIDFLPEPVDGLPVLFVEDDFEAENEIVSPKQRKQAEKAARKAEKTRRKLAKRREKLEKKKAKAAEKQRKKLEKHREKMGKAEQLEILEAADADNGDDEEEKKEEPEDRHRFYRDGWRANGARLIVTIEFEPEVRVQRTDGYLGDFGTNFPHKETNSGCEGWLEVSINKSDFVRQFCYIQQYPTPRLQICRGDQLGKPASTIADLGRMALRDDLNLVEVKGVDIRSISTGTQSSSSFAVTATQRTGSGYITDFEIGLVAGTIVKSTDLRDVTRTAETAPALYCTVELQKLQTAASRSASLSCLIEAVDSGSGDPARLYKLHVRGIGVDGWDGTQDGVGTYENEQAIRDIFAPFGEVKEVMIRHRIADDGSAPQNTSWCLVAFSDPNAVERALDKAEIVAGSNVLTVTKFSEKQAAKSKGSMRVFKRGGKLSFEESEVKLIIARPRPGCHEATLKIGWPKQSSNQPLELDLAHEDVEVSTVVGGKDGRLYCVRVSCGDTKIILDCHDAISLYGWISSLQAAAQQVLPEHVQSVCSEVVRDSLSPEWAEDFELKLYGVTSAARLVVSVYNSSTPPDKKSPLPISHHLSRLVTKRAPKENHRDLIGRCELEISPHDGPLLSGSFSSSAEMTSNGKMTLNRTPKLLSAKLTGPEGEDAGAVELQLQYIPVISQEETQRKRLGADGDLLKAFVGPEREENLYQFRASSGVIGQHWLLALRWCAEGCVGSFFPEPPHPGQLRTMQMTRVVRNVALTNLPFSRATLLLHHLYTMRVMGSHKPTRRRTLYTIFNLELHASRTPAIGKKVKKAAFAGLHLDELQGLNFYQTLQRLSLLHYGKRRCLNFEQQVKEYMMESRHVALHMISTVLGMYVFRRVKRVGGAAWPWAEAWQRFPNTYQLAVEGVAVSRLRTLSVLMKEVQKRRPPLLDVQLPSRKSMIEKAAENVVGAVSGGVREAEDAATSCCGFRRADSPPDDENSAHTSIVSFNGGDEGQRTPEEERAYVGKIWERLDVDDSGALDPDEVRRAMETLGHKKLSDSDFNTAMAGLDADGSGEVTFDEFMTWWNEDDNHPVGGWKQQLLDRAHRTQQLRQLFRLIDVDGSGRIDNDEVKNALAKMKRGGMPADEVARIDDVFKSLMDDTGTVGPDGFVEAMFKMTRIDSYNEDDDDSDLDELDNDEDTIRSAHFAELHE